MSVISKHAVEQYLARPLRNSRKAKLFSAQAIDAKLAKLQPRPRFTTAPLLHQKIGFLLTTKYDGYLLLYDMGLGKSKVTLDAFNWRRQTGEARTLLVLVPGATNVHTWLQQVRTHAPHLKAVGVMADMKSFEEQATGADVVVITYAGWLAAICQKPPGSRQKGWRINKPVARQLGKLFDAVCFDEITQARNHQSLTWRACWNLSRTCRFRYGLTGTPFGKDTQSLWAIFKLVDHGEAFGTTLGLMRAALYDAKLNFWGGTDYTLRRGSRKVLFRMMAHSSIRYRTEECLDLPERVQVVRPVVFSDETWAYYDKLIEELREAKGNFRLLENVFTRLRQLTSGYLVVKDPEDGRVEIVFKNNPKMDALVELLNEIPPDKKVIVACVYKKTGELICTRLKQEKIKHDRLYSATKNKAQIMDRFNDPGHPLRVLVASEAIAYGNNLQGACNFMVIYESPVDPIIRKQLEGRIRRYGQRHTTFYYDLAVKRSIDMKLLKALRDNRNLHDEVVDGLATL